MTAQRSLNGNGDSLAGTHMAVDMHAGTEDPSVSARLLREPFGDTSGVHDLRIEYDQLSSMTKSERIHGFANRLMYSKWYKYFYMTMAALSFFTLLMGFTQDCPTHVFLFIEVVINAAMVSEVVLRCIALRANYWKSMANVIDMLVVALCCATLFVLLGPCTPGGGIEEAADMLILAFRNVIQLVRLLALLKRENPRNRARTTEVDFSALEQTDDAVHDSLYDHTEIHPSFSTPSRHI